MMLGLPQYGWITNNPLSISTSQYVAFFGQDDWKVTPKFTLNYGLRYDFEIPREEHANQASFWDPTAPSPMMAYSSQIAANLASAGESCPSCGNMTGAMTIVGQPGARYGRRQGPLQKKDFGPRLGFAYNPVPRIVIRAGAGVVYAPSLLQAAGGQSASSNDGFATATGITTSLNSETSPPIGSLYSPDPNLPASAQIPYSTGFVVGQGMVPSCLANPACVQGIDIGNGISNAYFDSYRNPYAIQWNANVQFTTVWNVKVELGYLANHGLFLINGLGKPMDQLHRHPQCKWLHCRRLDGPMRAGATSAEPFPVGPWR
jgi:hypothetical protein